jgi:hypothetical protein
MAQAVVAVALAALARLELESLLLVAPAALGCPHQ